MRPATAVSKKSQVSTRSIWKKYQSIKPEKNQFYCFKTISQILQAHQNKSHKEEKKEFYYHKINSPRKQLKQNSSFKDNTQKKMSSVMERNPTIKKTLSNNFFSTKEIGKQNTEYINIVKMKTQNEIKNQSKFLPYRQQCISIIKHSKILSQLQSITKQQIPCQKQQKPQLKHPPTNSKNPVAKHKPKKSKFQQQQSINIFNQTKDNQFAIQQWQNFQEDQGTFSMLINNKDKLT